MSRFLKSIRSAFRTFGRSSPIQIHPATLHPPAELDRQLQVYNAAPSSPVSRTKWTSSELSQLFDHAARYGGVPDWSCAVERRSACQCRRVWSRNVSKTLRDALEARSLLDNGSE